MTGKPLLIFDLDGTISDPTLGIGRSINYALASFGYPAVDDQVVARSIGLPIDLTFRRLVGGGSDDTVLGLVEKFRERYGEVGYSENTVYPGIPEALEHLAARGVPMGVCTLKREDFAERVLALFHLRSYFRFVRGGDIGVHKVDQLRILVEQGSADRSSTMIGDRAEDVKAARSNGLHSVGVLWGYGSREELIQVTPDHLLESPDELRELVRAGEIDILPCTR